MSKLRLFEGAVKDEEMKEVLHNILKNIGMAGFHYDRMLNKTEEKQNEEFLNTLVEIGNVTDRDSQNKMIDSLWYNAISRPNTGTWLRKMINQLYKECQGLRDDKDTKNEKIIILVNEERKALVPIISPVIQRVNHEISEHDKKRHKEFLNILVEIGNVTDRDSQSKMISSLSNNEYAISRLNTGEWLRETINTLYDECQRLRDKDTKNEKIILLGHEVSEALFQTIYPVIHQVHYEVGKHEEQQKAQSSPKPK